MKGLLIWDKINIILINKEIMTYLFTEAYLHVIIIRTVSGKSVAAAKSVEDAGLDPQSYTAITCSIHGLTADWDTAATKADAEC